ncbi:hypothetical protein AGDE_03664 [Angomonas deanei]|uniref:inosine/xanthosine triphosphatase n=1 Tax=Angomonas deanei TaxID=59799 RepID=A0A7G2C508_9TRYP|nr:hypothetical protein AGDE_03664 [Angomonas deanei]CAD2213823.1 Protein of unknown function DUF84, putative [Angomonas deanei]|eukprot:EPY40264.1 hypothetical protein AGDE_03664 [Angomonas deanei]
MKWAVGTTNKAKVASVTATVDKCFPTSTHTVTPVDVDSGVSAQPMSAEETIRGSRRRAEEALRLVPEADFGVGIEGGLECIADKWFECGWMTIVERNTGVVGIGSSARFEMSPVLMKPILEDGEELATVIDNITGDSDVRSSLGAMGVLTAGHLGRAAAYEHGLMFALAPFLSDAKFWKN